MKQVIMMSKKRKKTEEKRLMNSYTCQKLIRERRNMELYRMSQLRDKSQLHHGSTTSNQEPYLFFRLVAQEGQANFICICLSKHARNQIANEIHNLKPKSDSRLHDVKAWDHYVAFLSNECPNTLFKMLGESEIRMFQD